VHPALLHLYWHGHRTGSGPTESLSILTLDHVHECPVPDPVRPQLPLHVWRTRPPFNTWLLGPTRVHNHNANSMSRLDYCSAVLCGCKAGAVGRLQRVQNYAARVVTQSNRYTPSQPLLQSLHWLPVQQRLVYKTALISYKVNSIIPQ